MARLLCACKAYSVTHLIGRGNCGMGRCARCQWSIDQCVCKSPAPEESKAATAKAGAQ